MAGGWGGGGTVGLLRGLGTGLGRGSDPDWNTGGAVGLGPSWNTAVGGGVLGGVGVLGGEGSSLGSAGALGWGGGVACMGGCGGGWLGAWMVGWLLEWRRGVVLVWACGCVGLRLVGEWLESGLGEGLRDWGVPEEACCTDWLAGWPGGGFNGLGGAGAGFLVPINKKRI